MQSHDARIHTSYADLVRLQNHALSFTLLPHLHASNAMSGRHLSLFRGRGLNFEELRHYQLGDDIRSLDWKVTMRTGKPHVRVYSEEKDRHCLILVDQRSSMFFSSQHCMKSVVAAEVAALSAWRVLRDGDRIGVCIADTDKTHWQGASRAQPRLLEQLKQLAKTNQQLSALSTDDEKLTFSRWIDELSRRALKQSTIIIVSDWSGCSADDINRLKQLQRQNDVLAIMIVDPFETELPEKIAKQSWVVGDGTYQIMLDSQHKVAKASQFLLTEKQQQILQLQQLMAAKRLPCILLSTTGDHISQYKQAVGGG
ncbi:DUF58 domain-containing protein [Vibrio astriarenae]|uniref:DUF58 domain-containing protein n=1 Tax=Vibrio astriarenae TaxID=1481923 RepID=UPI003735020D